jgi:hypothetical protein
VNAVGAIYFSALEFIGVIMADYRLQNLGALNFQFGCLHHPFTCLFFIKEIF